MNIYQISAPTTEKDPGPGVKCRTTHITNKESNITKMAAVSHLKNKKEAKVRDDIEKVVIKCLDDGNLSVKLYRDVLGAAGVEIDSKV